MRFLAGLSICLALGGAASAESLDEFLEKPENSGVVASMLEAVGLRGFSRSYALIVGVSEFDEYSDLPTEKDPIRVRDFLIDEAGFDYVHVLTGDKVTKARLEELIVDEFRPMVGTDDRFLFYWSGHGVTLASGPGDIGFLPLADSEQGKYSSMVAMTDITRWDRYLKARQILYLLDSCFSGLAGVAPQSDLQEIAREQLSGPARHMLTAGRDNEQTIAIDDLGGSVFTYAVLKGLAGAADTTNDLGSDGLISVGELKSYISAEISVQRRKYNWSKSITPQLRDLSGSDGAFFFPVAGRLAGSRPGIGGNGNGTEGVVAQGGNQELVEIQRSLLDLGFDPGPISGRLSFATRRALTAFQQTSQLELTGLADEATQLALVIALAQPTPEFEPKLPWAPDLSTAKSDLIDLGILQETPQPTDENILAAVITFQTESGLETSGRLDPNTREAFRRSVAFKREFLDTLDTVIQPQEESDLADLFQEPTKDCENCPTMIVLKGGDVTMGRSDGKPEQGPKVNISVQPFAIATTETTKTQFDEYVLDEGLDFVSRKTEATPSCYEWTADNRLRREAFAYNQQSQAQPDHPVSCVSLEDVRGYIEWLNKKVDGSPYRLPTEEEFEYALLNGAIASDQINDVTPNCEMRNGADSSSSFPWKDPSCNDGFATVAPVASMAADSSGLYDLSGNLWEWTSDCWTPTHAEPYRAVNSGCDTGTVRGASFDDPLDNFHVSVRQPVPRKRRQSNIGFRVVKGLE